MGRAPRDLDTILARVESVNVGRPRPARLPEALTGSAGARERYVTAIAKAPVSGPIAVRTSNLDGDAQADTKNHGGCDKAVHAHFGRHLAWWGQKRGWPVSPGEIGENLTLGPAPDGRDLDETGFCIGDIISVGTAVLQVTQPRIPCFKQAAALRIADAVRLAGVTGRTGLYLRVLHEGTLQAGNLLWLIERPYPDVTVADANRFVHQTPHDAGLRARLAGCAGLGRDLRRRLHADTEP